MDRGIEYVATSPKNVLRAVAVMVIDVEDGDTRHTGVARDLRCHCGIVEVAIAAEIIRPGMMPGRATHGECCCLSCQNGVRRGDTRLCAPISRSPSVGRDRRRCIETIAAEQRIDAVQPQRASSDDRPDIGNGLAAAPRLAPEHGGFAQERKVIGIVDREQRSHAEVVRRFSHAECRRYRRRARRRFGISDKAAVVQFVRRVMAQLLWIEKAEHRQSVA